MTPTYPQLAVAVYQACTNYDQYLPKISTEVATAWAKVFAYSQLTAEDLLAAVDVVYASHGEGYRPLPADIAREARAIRQDRSMRESPAELPVAPASREKIAEAVAALAAARGVPLARTVELRNPLCVRCPWCKAGVGQHCAVVGSRCGQRPAGGFHPSRLELAERAGTPLPPAVGHNDLRKG